jgi:Arc/MetJ family transcription regulator
MQRTLEIDEKLLAEAQAALGEDDVQEVVTAGLREIVRARKLQELARAVGTEDLVDMTVEELLALRAKEAARLGE